VYIACVVVTGYKLIRDIAKTVYKIFETYASEILQPANLLSLSRVLLIPFIGHYLWRGDNQATIICTLLLIVAGITDILDGYIARRLNQVSRLGMVLDPLADKILAVALVVMLIFFRDFPVWLAVVIVGRDLLILTAGMVLLKSSNIVIPSNLTGKYTFAAIAFLLGSYIIRFDFGATLMTYVTVTLIIASTIIYARNFVLVRRGVFPVPFADRRLYRITRAVVSVAVLGGYFYKLYLFLYG
jgi:CDP-diacylglycerol--glycerol-3-phosphate 3-phosphatidyltransferase